MSTRRVKDGQRRMQNGWASATEFEDLRGLNGTAVALKAELIDEQRTKNLLYFLQGMSLKPGGVKRIAREFMEMFPERLGTPTMHRIGCKPGKRLTQKERDDIHMELNPPDSLYDVLSEIDSDGREKNPCNLTAAEFLEQCRSMAENRLDSLLERLCCDPSMMPTSNQSEAERYRAVARAALEGTEHEEKTYTFRIAAPVYFHDLMGALFEYQERYAARIRENFVETSIGKVVFEALDYALETGRSALIEGNSGIGKTTALEAWCEMHSGQARLIKLKGITHRTGFFREVAKALGLARGTGLSPAQIQYRVEQFLQHTKIMLVIDEGQYLFPAGKRVSAHPELICWLLTACYNERIPFAISATAEFRKRRAIIEKNTTWQSEQLRRRIRRDFELPQLPTKDDLFAVATKLLPDQSQSAIDYVVGYSLASKGFFQAITDAIDDARLIARRDGRDKITFADLKTVILDWRSPSDNALQRVFEAPKTRSGRHGKTEIEIDLPENSAANKERLNDSFSPVKRQDFSLVQTS